jgi:hypothetical protein
LALPSYSTISGEFASFLANERERVLPFVGAGISVDAGVPAADALAELIAARAGEEGVAIGGGTTFADVCRAVSDQLTHGRLQEITASVVDELPLTPTPLQRLIVRCWRTDDSVGVWRSGCRFGRGWVSSIAPLNGKPFALPGDEATRNFGSAVSQCCL